MSDEKDDRPSSIDHMWLPAWVVKLLDFGLAKAFTPEREAPQEASREHSPTLTIGATEAGVILGTAA